MRGVRVGNAFFTDQPHYWLRISQAWLFLGKLYQKPGLHLEFKNSLCFEYGLENTYGPQAAYLPLTISGHIYRSQ